MSWFLVYNKCRLLRGFAGLAAASIAHCFIFSASAAAHPGWGIVLDRQGQVYFGDVEQNTIWRINKQGKLEALATGKHSHSLFLAEDGTVFGEHVYYDAAGARWISSIWKLTPDGHVSDVMPPTSSPPKGSGIFMDREGNIYSVYGGASESREAALLKRTPVGEISVFAGGEQGHRDGKGDQARFMDILGMAWGPDGSLYLMDRSCVRRVKPDQTVTTVGGDPLAGVDRGEHPRLLGLAVDGEGNVYAADYDYHCIRRIAQDGGVSTLLSDGFFWSPSGVTVVGDDLYILEHQTESPVAVLGALGVGPYARVRRLSRDGTVTTLATLWGRNTGVGVAVVAAVIVSTVLVWRIRRRRRRSRL
ncbi:MAG TPA: hypothetical protein VJH03_09330 [Blastocatellia bacterium]|nr:hypothetical protein [Blastocatellia bacterium]